MLIINHLSTPSNQEKTGEARFLEIEFILIIHKNIDFYYKTWNSLLEINQSGGRLLRKDTICQLSKDSKMRVAEEIIFPALLLYQPHDLGCVSHGFGTHRMSLDMYRIGLDTRRMGKYSNHHHCDEYRNLSHAFFTRMMNNLIHATGIKTRTTG